MFHSSPSRLSSYFIHQFHPTFKLSNTLYFWFWSYSHLDIIRLILNILYSLKVFLLVLSFIFIFSEKKGGTVVSLLFNTNNNNNNQKCLPSNTKKKVKHYVFVWHQLIETVSTDWNWRWSVGMFCFGHLNFSGSLSDH